MVTYLLFILGMVGIAPRLCSPLVYVSYLKADRKMRERLVDEWCFYYF